MIKCCIFDLDGTLLSTLETITFHLNNTLRQEGLSEITLDECRAFIGDGARKLVGRAIAKSGVTDTATLERVLRVYNEAYNDSPLPETEPYPGITELIDRLYSSGINLAVVTNKPERTARLLIDHFFEGRFSAVVGGREGVPLKPDPTSSLGVIGSLGLASGETAFIGDTAVDITTGRNMCAALSVGVCWGFRSEDELLGAGADALAHTADELSRIILGRGV